LILGVGDTVFPAEPYALEKEVREKRRGKIPGRGESGRDVKGGTSGGGGEEVGRMRRRDERGVGSRGGGEKAEKKWSKGRER